MENNELTIKTDKIYEGKILTLKVDTVELPNKRYSKREIVLHNPAVAIVAATEDGEIVMIKQYRKAVDDLIYEIPAGLIEYGENPKDAALRELEEETGYRAGKIEYLSEFYTSPGFCNEKIHVFLATQLEQVGQNLDDGEDIEYFNVKLEEAIKMIKLGDIVDAKTISSILLYKEIGMENDDK
jgi:ADP-ribose pyrophosphatase